jgi:hypothetical protein
MNETGTDVDIFFFTVDLEYTFNKTDTTSDAVFFEFKVDVRNE